MSLDTFIAGRYSSTYNAVDTGISEDGTELQQDMNAEVIQQSDAFGDSIIDFVWRGGSVYAQMNSLAYKAGSQAAFWPYGNTTIGPGILGMLYDSTQNANQLPIGQLASNIAKALVLTSVAGTPANVAANPNTLTGPLSTLAPNSNLRLTFTSKLRKVPLRLLLLPKTLGGLYYWHVST